MNIMNIWQVLLLIFGILWLTMNLNSIMKYGGGET